MKKFIFSTSIVAAFVLSGCMTAKNVTVLDTVGPVRKELTAKNSTNGTLIVYSAYEVNADFNARDPNRPEYSDYKILTAGGKLLQKVHNNTGTILADPLPVPLTPGKYIVVVRANGYGRLTIPVVIEARRSTVLHLEGGGSWPDESVFNQTNAVRLDDGQIIGWKMYGEN
ncbi:MAG TPA: hypothetical protein VHG71_09700 [Verrucomicrobiae bacterium]|nr:hypothetical protein [Verrucomicrobiae bacterium]